jgi:hypothetical protein
MTVDFQELSRETENFVLEYKWNRARDRAELRLVSKTGRHRAVHTMFNVLDDYGKIIENRPITFPVAQFIFKHFERRGDTESFNIYASDLETGELTSHATVDVTSSDVRHKETVAENSFTATGQKLHFHWPIFKKLKETGFGSIVRATLTNHQVCSSHCQYCSTISRNRADSVTLDEAKAFVEKLYVDQAAYNREHFPEYNDLYREQCGSDIRLRGLILSGGGQPNLWPHFEPFVEWLATLDLDIGLITNGFPKKIDEAIYDHFKWIRISITPEDASPHYVDGRFDLQYLPDTVRNNPDVTVGYSYVHGPWTDDEIFMRIDNAIKGNGFDYCRVLTDCNLTRIAQLRAHQDLGDRLHKLDLVDADGNPKSKIFHQLKFHGNHDEANELWDEGQCFLQSYNVFWDTTGHDEAGHSYCYPCDSITVLAEEQTKDFVTASERRFNHRKWGTVKNTEVEKLYREKVKPFFDPRDICSSCLFMRNNQTVKDLRARDGYDDIAVNPDVQHLNFP